MSSEFWAAIVGAVVGGLMAALVQYMTLQRQKIEEKKKQRDRDQALGRGLIFKLMRLMSNLYNVNLHLEESRARAQAGMDQEPWSYVLPIANLPERVKITSDEAALVLERDATVLNNLLDLEATHDSSLQIMHTYGDLRPALMERMPNARFRGQAGVSELTQEQTVVLRPRMIELNSIINALSARSSSDYVFAKTTFIEVNKILERRYGIKFSFKFEERK